MWIIGQRWIRQDAESTLHPGQPRTKQSWRALDLCAVVVIAFFGVDVKSRGVAQDSMLTVEWQTRRWWRIHRHLLLQAWWRWAIGSMGRDRAHASDRGRHTRVSKGGAAAPGEAHGEDATRMRPVVVLPPLLLLLPVAMV